MGISALAVPVFPSCSQLNTPCLAFAVNHRRLRRAEDLKPIGWVGRLAIRFGGEEQPSLKRCESVGRPDRLACHAPARTVMFALKEARMDKTLDVTIREPEAAGHSPTRATARRSVAWSAAYSVWCGVPVGGQSGGADHYKKVTD
jgi:hypothetical protein